MKGSDIEKIKKRMDLVSCVFQIRANSFLPEDFKKEYMNEATGFLAVGGNNFCGASWKDEASKDLLTYLFGTEKRSDESFKRLAEWNKSLVIRNRKEIENISTKNDIKKSKSGYIYLLKSRNLYKIGRTFTPESRMKTYKTENPHGINCILMVEVGDYIKKELELLEKFRHKKYRGEWHKLDNSDVEEIKNLLNHGKN